MNYSLFVVTHKKVDIKLGKDEKLIVAGCDVNDINYNDYKLGTFFDNVGDNISYKNSDYSELTALYWIWKNTNDDIVGLEHYRRFIYFPFFKVGVLYPSKHRVKKVLNKYDILVLPFECWQGTKNMGEVLHSWREQYYDIAFSIIKEKNPEMMPAVKTYLNQNSFCGGNMFICKKQTLDKYCEWMFPLLFEIERRANEQKVPKMNRVYGYLAEYLSKIYYIHNNLRMYNFYFRGKRMSVFKVLCDIVYRHSLKRIICLFSKKRSL